ncbi:hypothetical protein EOE48_27090 [Methylobacterium oryzihabitans]|uniref:Uncharacterized protein n=1 Tax=Methylobacterium oryzihabitans TaxID=2499852 RepID=A0A3S2V4A1_9HYPH|nr:hypothetical protein EOE48_27090 [Methylobacterium oryzihabitans]
MPGILPRRSADGRPPDRLLWSDMRRSKRRTFVPAEAAMPDGSTYRP